MGDAYIPPQCERLKITANNACVFTVASYQTQQPLFLDVFGSACSDAVEEEPFCSRTTVSFLVVHFSPLLQ